MGAGGVARMAIKVARRWRWKRIAPAHAKDGDRAIGATAGGLTCFIRYRGFWVGRADRGNWLASDAEIARAWSVI